MRWTKITENTVEKKENLRRREGDLERGLGSWIGEAFRDLSFNFRLPGLVRQAGFEMEGLPRMSVEVELPPEMGDIRIRRNLNQ